MANSTTNHPFIRSPYNYDWKELSDETGTKVMSKSKTQQNDVAASDINNIVKQFGLTGKLPDNIKTPTYGDYDGVTDFHTAQNMIAEARSNFMLLPAKVRSRFQNDPQQFLKFMDNPKNVEEAVELGILKNKRTDDEQRQQDRGSNLHGKAVQTRPGEPGGGASGAERDHGRGASSRGSALQSEYGDASRDDGGDATAPVRGKRD